MKALRRDEETNQNRYLHCRFVHVACVTITTLFCFHIFSYYRSTTNNYIHNFNQINNKEISCDLSQGQWIPDPTDPLYTNYTCTTIPWKRNCFFHGRNDTHFLHWRWKPDNCQLPRFHPLTFLNAVRGKTLAFIGDSLSQNQMESLLCLLSTVEKPERIEMPLNPTATKTDIRERLISAKWKFPDHNFTLMALWSQFLVSAAKIKPNGPTTGGYNLQLDRVDTNWTQHLPSIDYAVFSAAQWFFRQNNLYEGGNLIGCTYCNHTNVTDFGPGFAIRRAFRAAFKAVNERNNILTLLRTYSPTHFENGDWDTGGGCNRTWPVGRDEVNRAGPDWDYRKIQLEEMGIARKQGKQSGNKFGVVDVTEMMLMRPDAHPGLYWGNKWLKGHSDCLHWCMPGPIDTWNELLLQSITSSKHLN